jgi:LmbE family N-acetylglucosaminyl deacetylase
MATLVTFHAHPDDECIATGGVMAKAAAEGHRVVLVVATRGERGEVAEGVLDPGEPVPKRRSAETRASAAVLGASRVVFLDYIDSGMMGEATNDTPGSFWTADVDEAAGHLAEVLREEAADVLTVYDDHGGYGHPDHIQVHRVGHRAAERAGVERVYEATMNRDEIRRLMAASAEAAAEAAELPDTDETANFGSPEAMITAGVDVRAFLDKKRDAMRVHASQIAEEHFMLAMPDEDFAAAFGTEWFIRAGQGPGVTETDLMAGLPTGD